MSVGALEQRRISLRHNRPGEQRAPCPNCNRRKPDSALAVLLKPNGSATWMCHRCGWKGSVGPERPRDPPKPTPWQLKRRSEREQHVTLAPWALDLWQACRTIEPGTPPATYLHQRCCIVPPCDLRGHPDLPDKVSGYRGPALVGLVTDVLTGEPINLHRTWLALDGGGKAPIDKPRRLFKAHRSRGVIHLWPDEAVTRGIVVGEGIETCLSAALEGLVPVWATVSADNLAEFPVLPGIEGITILVDHDKPNPRTGKRAGTEAALKLIDRYTAAGFDPQRDIRVYYPPAEGEDVNDLVRRRRGAA